MTVTGWFELPEEDRPPEQIWLDDEELEQHFERVADRWKNPGSSEMEPITDAPLVANELTAGLRGRR